MNVLRRLVVCATPALAPRTTSVRHRSLCCSAWRRAPHDVPAVLAKDLQSLTHHSKLVLFLTGTPQHPRCRFTVMLLDIINQLGVEYSYFDILDDEEVCEGLKVFSDWPTYPQLYLDGKLIGGYDVCKAMMLDGSLIKLFEEHKLIQ